MQLGLEVAAQHDVGAAAGHVGGDGDGAGAAGVGDHVRLALVLLGVEHVVLDRFLLQQPGQVLGGLDRGGADQHRLLAGHAVADVVDDRRELVRLPQVDEIGGILADHRPVRGNHHHLEAVDLQELGRLGIGRAGHARELAVQPEVVLEGDRGDRLVLLAHAHVFLGLDRLVQAVGPAPADHGAPGELVDDDDLAAAHDVLDVAPVERVRAQRRVEVMHQAHVGRVVQAVALAQQPGLEHQSLDVLVAVLGQVDLLALLVHGIIARAILARLALQARHQHVDALVDLGALLGRPGDDQRRARLVDQDRIDLVDDGVGQPPLDTILEAERQVVAQVIEAEFVVGAEGDVAGVGGALLGGILLALDHADRQAQETVHGTHPVRVTLRQVFVDGDDVHALAAERVEVGRERRHQRLALAGAHLGDLAFVQGEAADQLHVEVAHAEHPARRFAHHGEGFRLQFRERRARGQPRAKFHRLVAQLLVGQGREPILERRRSAHRAAVAFNQPVIPAAKQSRQGPKHLTNPLESIR